MKYFVGTELGVANFLNRNFDWIANALWYEEIPHARDRRRTMFFLGGKDDIISADVRLFLLCSPLRSSDCMCLSSPGPCSA